MNFLTNLTPKSKSENEARNFNISPFQNIKDFRYRLIHSRKQAFRKSNIFDVSTISLWNLWSNFRTVSPIWLHFSRRIHTFCIYNPPNVISTICSFQNMENFLNQQHTAENEHFENQKYLTYQQFSLWDLFSKKKTKTNHTPAQNF